MDRSRAKNGLASPRAHPVAVTGDSFDGWRPIATAPKDGTTIQASIPGNGDDNMIAWVHGIEGENGTVSAWTFTSEQEPPADWTDGWCWAVNDVGEPSTKPTHWKPAPPPRA